MTLSSPVPRSGPRWRRILSHPAALMVIGCVWIGVAEAAPLTAVSALWGGRGPARIIAEIVTALWLILAWKLYKRWVERARDSELPWRGALAEWGAGLATGVLLFSAMTGVVALLGGLRVLGVSPDCWSQLGAMLGMAAMSGVGEEILFRGILLRQLERLVGTWGALALTSAFFGAAHLGNAGATWFAALAIAMEAGILLGAAYLATRRLWLAIGIHGAWNFTQGWVFSVPVSGGHAPQGLFVTTRAGPEWLTGGTFGLEASAVAMVVATLAGVLMLTRARGVVPPPWRRSGDQTKE